MKIPLRATVIIELEAPNDYNKENIQKEIFYYDVEPENSQLEVKDSYIAHFEAYY